jgi:PEP-CTERM motif
MNHPMKGKFVRFVASLVLVAAVSVGSAVAGSSAGILYESFGSNGISSLNLTNSPTGASFFIHTATNIVAGGGMVYFQDGNTIYSTTANLVGLNVVITNNVTPTGLALDAQDGILYETFGSDGISAINLANLRGLGSLFVTATNIVAGGGMVYFESGNTIYSTSANLVGLHAVINNNVTPTCLALNAQDGILYETFGSNGVSAINLADLRGIGDLGVTATNIVAGNGMVYFESGDTIYSSSTDLVGLNAIHTNGQAPVGLALIPSSASVPEPSALPLMLFGLVGLAGQLFVSRRNRSQALHPQPVTWAKFRH